VLKYFFLAIVFSIIGYGVAVFVPPSETGLDRLIGYGESTDGLFAANGESAPPLGTDAGAPQTQKYPAGSFLTAVDLLSTPGVSKPLGFKVGPAISSGDVPAVLERLKDILTLSKARYVTGNENEAVIIIGNSYPDLAAAIKDRKLLQSLVTERLEIIYLPGCIQEKTEDDAGFLCGLPPEPDDEKISN